MRVLNNEELHRGFGQFGGNEDAHVSRIDNMGPAGTFFAQLEVFGLRIGNQFGRPKVSVVSAFWPWPAYQSAPSQPLTSRKYAPISARRWW